MVLVHAAATGAVHALTYRQTGSQNEVMERGNIHGRRQRQKEPGRGGTKDAGSPGKQIDRQTGKHRANCMCFASYLPNCCDIT